MQNIREVLRSKEQQAEQLQKEIEALRFSIRILEEEENPPKVGSRNLETMSAKDNGTKPNGTGIKQFP
jgi:prefoldin subunit 5